MKRLKVLEAIAILSTSAISIMAIMIYLNNAIVLSLFYMVTIPILLVYIFSIIETIISLIIGGLKSAKVRLLAHLSTVLIIALLLFISSDIVKGKSILTARLYDDLFNYTLIFREGGNCEMNIIGIFGYQKDIKGSYYQKGDTIIFTKKPYENDFIPDTILINRGEGGIFLYRDSLGYFTRKKDRSSYFEIVE